jgi:serine/threonine-protein kinase
MARVYVAHDRELDQRVALKILVPRPGNAAMVERMRREAVSLERIDHPNIVHTLAHGETEEGGYYIAMELIEGPSITEFIKENRTDPEGSMRLLMQLCSALRHAHRKGLVHRDLKSSNLLVTKDDRGRSRVKLIDFGVVKISGEDTLSGNRQIVGSVHTMAPEQVKGEALDHRADIYAVGVLAYRLVSGQYPFHSRIPAETITQHVHAEIPILDDPMLPTGLSELVAKCMAKDPRDRFQDAQELMDALSEALDVPTAAFTKPLRPKTLTPPPPEDQDSPDVGSRVAVAAVAVVLAAAMLIWIFI